MITMESEIDDEEAKKTCLSDIVSITGLSPDRVFLFDNYVKDSVRTKEKDAVYAQILMKAFSDAYKSARSS